MSFVSHGSYLTVSSISTYNKFIELYSKLCYQQRINSLRFGWSELQVAGSTIGQRDKTMSGYGRDVPISGNKRDVP